MEKERSGSHTQKQIVSNMMDIGVWSGQEDRKDDVIHREMKMFKHWGGSQTYLLESYNQLYLLKHLNIIYKSFIQFPRTHQLRKNFSAKKTYRHLLCTVRKEIRRAS